MKWPRLALLLLFGSCAVAGSKDESGNTTFVDASIQVNFPDARPPSDAAPALPDAAAVAIDAASSVTVDAGLFCDDSAQCTEAGTCCFSLGGPGFCVPGEVVIGVCLPD